MLQGRFILVTLQVLRLWSMHMAVTGVNYRLRNSACGLSPHLGMGLA